MKEHRIGMRWRMRVGIGMPIIEAPSHRFDTYTWPLFGRKSKCGKVLGQSKNKWNKWLERQARRIVSKVNKLFGFEIKSIFMPSESRQRRDSAGKVAMKEKSMLGPQDKSIKAKFHILIYCKYIYLFRLNFTFSRFHSTKRKCQAKPARKTENEMNRKRKHDKPAGERVWKILRELFGYWMGRRQHRSAN